MLGTVLTRRMRLVGVTVPLLTGLLVTGCNPLAILGVIQIIEDNRKLREETLPRLIEGAVRKYEAVADQVKLGDSKQQVLALLSPTHEGLPASLLKEAENYYKDGVIVDIYYARSGPHPPKYSPDRLRADEDFTPYVFHDGILVAIGWVKP